jgi:hypothetical protein
MVVVQEGEGQGCEGHEREGQERDSDPNDWGRRFLMISFIEVPGRKMSLATSCVAKVGAELLRIPEFRVRRVPRNWPDVILYPSE